MNDADGPPDCVRPELHLRLLGGFELRAGGERLEVPVPGRRLLAYLGVEHRVLDRAYVAGVLWPDTTDAKAAASLRTTVWRLHGIEPVLLAVTPTSVALAPEVEVDVSFLESTAAVLRSGDPSSELGPVDPRRLGGELLPEMWDAWLVFERERLRQVSLHALELLSQRLTEAGQHDQAVVAALHAVEAEPLRETANRRLVLAHLAEGNVTEAARSYRRYAELLDTELGLEPQPSFTDLLAPSLLHQVATRPGPRRSSGRAGHLDRSPAPTGANGANPPAWPPTNDHRGSMTARVRASPTTRR